MNLTQFLYQLESLQEPASLFQLKELLSDLELDSASDESCFHFSTEKYQRNLLFRNDHCEALLLCFEAGQRTPIHDHAGSACGVKVVQGEGTETCYQSSPDGWLFATGSEVLPEGGVVGSQDMDIHQLSNLQPDGRRLATLHVYSPPLGEVGNYSTTDNSVQQVRAAERVLDAVSQ